MWEHTNHKPVHIGADTRFGATVTCSGGLMKCGSISQRTAARVFAAAHGQQALPLQRTRPAGLAAAALPTMQEPWGSLNSVSTDFLVLCDLLYRC